VKLRNLFLLNTVIALLFALGFLLLPGVLLDLFGFVNNAGAQLLGRFTGTELLVGGLITFFARDWRDSNALQAIILANLVASLVGFIASLAGVVSGAMGAMGWLIVATYLLLTLGFGYFQFVGPRRRSISSVRRRRV
jgi:hypothetical protein